MSSDEDQAPAPKPGLFRRLFGGRSPGIVPEQVEPDDASTAEASVPEAAELPAFPVASERIDPDASPPVPPPGGPGWDAGDADPEALVDAAVALPEATSDGEPVAVGRPSWWNRLRQGLSRSSSSISQGIVDVFAKRKLDATTLEDLEDILVRADLGVAMAARITEAVGRGRYDKGIDPEDVKTVLAEQIEAVLRPVARPFTLPAGTRPFTVLVVGVNGSGKTTTIGKLAAKFTAERRSVMLAAGDTFRAAAVEQLRIWGARTGVPVITRDSGADAAGLAFDALTQARAENTDVLLIDTAGRLQNRTELMDELAKVIRVLRKVDPEAPHAVLLVLDATVGQNALSQVEIFSRVAGVTGLVLTKLDGTARGGILVAIAEKFALPVHFIGVGEGVDDLEPFEARDFAQAIAGLDRPGI